MNIITSTYRRTFNNYKMRIYKQKVLNTLKNGRLSPNSNLSKDNLPRDIFKLIFNLIKRNLDEIYLLQYSKMDIRLDNGFKFVECADCGLSMRTIDYIKSYEVISKCCDYNLYYDELANKLTSNCGTEIGQCSLCKNCNKLKYIPRINMFYCEDHAKSVLYSQKHDMFSNLYKQCPGIDDFKKIGNNEALLKKLNNVSIVGVNSKNIARVRKRWFTNNPLPKYEYKDKSWDDSDDDDEKHNYVYQSANGYIYDSSPLSSPLIFYDGVLKRFKSEKI